MNKLNTEEIKHIRDLTLADSINGNDKTINGSILRKLDEQLTIPVVSKSFYCGSAVFVGSSCQSECTTCKGLNK